MKKLIKKTNLRQKIITATLLCLLVILIIVAVQIGSDAPTAYAHNSTVDDGYASCCLDSYDGHSHHTHAGIAVIDLQKNCFTR